MSKTKIKNKKTIESLKFQDVFKSENKNKKIGRFTKKVDMV